MADKKKLSYILYIFIFLFIIICGALSFYLTEAVGIYKVYHVEFEITGPQKDQYAQFQGDLENEIRSEFGKNIWNIHLKGILSKFSKWNWIQDMQVQRQFPNRIKVVVMPKKVVAHIKISKKFSRPVTQDGDLLNKMKILETFDVPLLNYRPFLKNKSLRKSAAKILSVLPQSGDISMKTISSVEYDFLGDKILFKFINHRFKVHLGRENIRVRQGRAEKVLEYLEKESITASVIDAGFSKKVLVKRVGPR